MNTEGTILIL